MADVLKKVPVREQDPKVRATNFEEVCLGYNKEEAMEEAQRCLGCKNAKCVEGCPVSIDIPGFIKEIKEGNMLGLVEGKIKEVGEDKIERKPRKPRQPRNNDSDKKEEKSEEVKTEENN